MWWLPLGAATAVIGVVVWLEHRRLTRELQRELTTFVELFPGRCPICSYHRWGYANAHTHEPRPAPHECPEEGRGCR